MTNFGRLGACPLLLAQTCLDHVVVAFGIDVEDRTLLGADFAEEVAR